MYTATRRPGRMYLSICAGKCRCLVRRAAALLAALALMLWAGTVPAAESPARIVTLAPHLTELVYAAGAGPLLVGTVNSSDYPPQSRSLPRLGDGLQLDPESLLALKPTLVLGWQSAPLDALRPLLDSLHIRTALFYPRRLADLPATVRAIGKLAGTQAQADTAAAQMEQRINHLATIQGTPVRAVIEISDAPLYVVGNDPILNDMLGHCGAHNLYAGALPAAPQINAETLLVDQPDVIIVGTADPAALELRRRALADLGLLAARQGHVIGVDPDILFRPGPRLIDAAEQLCSRLAKARKP